MMRWGSLRIVCSAVAIGLAAPVEAADMDKDAAALLQNVQKRMEAQDKRIAELEARLTDKKMQEVRREEIMAIIEEINKDAEERTSLPSWMEDLKFYGDLRLRYQMDCWDTHSGSSGTAPDAKKRHRARFRVRFGIKKTWLDDQIEVGFRLATGSADADDWDDYGGSDPTSTNQTLTGVFSEKPIWIDLAYATYRPDAVPGFWITGGKFKNPFQTSSLFIDSDVNPEGVYAQYSIPGLGPVEPFVGFGYFILEESGQGHDVDMHGYAIGATWKITDDVKWTLVGNVWDYDNYEDAPVSSRGNTSGWTQDFLVVNLHTKVDFKAFNLPWSVFFDYAHNCREAESDPQLAGLDDAYHFGVKVGKNKRKGDWSVSYGYAWIEHNSLPGHITDGDFARTNRKGHVLKANYSITDAVTAGLSLFYTQPIRSTPISGASEDERLTLQADLVWKF